MIWPGSTIWSSSRAKWGRPSISVGMAAVFSSSDFIGRLLGEKKCPDRTAGKVTFGLIKYHPDHRLYPSIQGVHPGRSIRAGAVQGMDSIHRLGVAGRQPRNDPAGFERSALRL